MCEDVTATKLHRSVSIMLPRIVAEIAFLTPGDGGRKHPPFFTPEMSIRYRYLPHIVVQDRNIRHALVDENHQGLEDYLGVSFSSGPEGYVAGQSPQFELEHMYHPQVNYDRVQPGATFEGPKVVGHG